MEVEPANVLLGAAAALMTREAVDAHKARRAKRAAGDAVLRAVRDALAELEELADSNLRAVRDEGELGRSQLSEPSAVVKPIQPLPTRLDELARGLKPEDPLYNSKVLKALSYVTTTAKYLNAVEDARMRFVAAQDAEQLALARYNKDHFRQLADTLKSYEYELMEHYAQLLNLVFEAEVLVLIIEADRLRERGPRAWPTRFTISFGGFGVIGARVYVATIGQQDLLRALGDEELGETIDGAYFGLSDAELRMTLRVFAEWGLTKPHDAFRLMSILTPRGLVTAGATSRRWIRPFGEDPVEREFDWARYPLPNEGAPQVRAPR